MDQPLAQEQQCWLQRMQGIWTWVTLAGDRRVMTSKMEREDCGRTGRMWIVHRRAFA